MPETVTVSSVDRREKLKTRIEELFRKKQYEEISHAIGMYSVLIDPNRMIQDQKELYGTVLSMIKDRASKTMAKNYASWLAAFPKLMAELASTKKIVTDKASAGVIATYHNAYGPFESLDEFFTWALNDRRLALGQIAKYIEKTAEMHRGKT